MEPRFKDHAPRFQGVEMLLAFGSLLTGGVFARFPGLKAAFLEGSCSWVPWWLWSLDERVEKFGDDERRILGDNCPRLYNLA